MRTTKANFSYFIWNWILRCILCLSKLRLIDVVNRSRQLRNSKVKYIDSFFTRPSPRGRVVFSLKPSTFILTASKICKIYCWLRNELTCTPIQTIKLKTRLRNLSFFFSEILQSITFSPSAGTRARNIDPCPQSSHLRPWTNCRKTF